MKKLLIALLLLVSTPALAGNSVAGGTSGQIQVNNGGSLGALPNGDASKPWATKRPPAVTDDTTAGYVAANLWNYGGYQYQAQSVSAGAAAWQRVIASAPSELVGDAVTSAVGLYGVYKMRNAYLGNAFSITRTSDSATLAIGFDSRGEADWKSLDLFCAATICGVNTIYDQSGNGYDIAAATAKLAQAGTNSMGVNRSISFTVASPNQYYTNSSLPITNVQNMTVMLDYRPILGQLSAVSYEIGYPTAKYTYYTLTGAGMQAGGGNWTGTAAARTDQTISIIATNGASSQTLYQNDMTATRAAPTSSAATGFQLGSGLGDVSYPGWFEFRGMAIYNSTLSAANIALLKESVYSRDNISPQVRDVIAQQGDSITADTVGGAVNQQVSDYAWAVQMQQALNHPFAYYNLGHAGETAASMVAETTTWATATHQAGALNIATVFAGTNDLAASTSITPATIIGYIQSMCTTWQAAGAKCVVYTMLPRCAGFSGGQASATFETTRLAFNAALKAATFYDALVDVGGDPVIGSAANFCSVTYSADYIHPNVLASSFITADTVAALKPLIQ